TGKTAMAEYVVDELEKHSPEVLSGFVDGFGQPSRFEVYYKLLRDMNEFVTRGGTSTGELVDKFEEKAYDSPMVCWDPLVPCMCRFIASAIASGTEWICCPLSQLI
ncbi:hypothetical protein HRED_03674, partial [Candidatus Haloredivivus sp. G17]